MCGIVWTRAYNADFYPDRDAVGEGLIQGLDDEKQMLAAKLERFYIRVC
jgi:hypothetical protein